ncbi:hypothetical protein P3342_005056 [Pyrenophora teres f. teres]|nr:hypothetical protein P3342_005056 [Pyrenophora teres f. teres]
MANDANAKPKPKPNAPNGASELGETVRPRPSGKQAQVVALSAGLDRNSGSLGAAQKNLDRTWRAYYAAHGS